MTQGVKSPVRKNYADSIHSESVFFGASSPINNKNQVNTEKSNDDDNMTPLSMYNTSFNINKELQNIIQQLRLELNEQREFFTKLNKSHTNLQAKYSKDIQSLTKKIEHLSNEKHELMKDLDLALERERSITKQSNDKIAVNNDIKTILNNDIDEYKKQIEQLNKKNKELDEQQIELKQVLDIVNKLQSQFKQQSYVNNENHEKIKLVFEDTAIQLEKYHQSQSMVESLNIQIELLKHQKSEYFTVLTQWMQNLPKNVYFGENSNSPKSISADIDNVNSELDWNKIRMKLSQITKNIAVVIAEHERIQNELRIKLENEKNNTHKYPQKMKELQNENNGLKEEINKNGTEIKLLIGNNKVIEEANLKLIEENKSLNQAIDSLTNKCQTLCDEKNDIDDKYKNFEKGTQGLNDKITELSVEIEKLSTEKQQLSKSHESELEIVSKTNNELSEANTELTLKMEKLNEEMANNKHNIDLLLSVTGEKEKLLAKNKSLNEEIANYVLQLEKECDDTEIIKKERDSYRNKYDDLKKEIEELKSELETKSESVGVAIIGNTDGMKKADIMSSFISLQSDTSQNVSIINTNTKNKQFPALRVETDATPFNAKLNEQLTQKNDNLTKENNILKKKLISSQSLNRELKDKFQTNKRNTIKKYENIAKKVSTMREIINKKDDEVRGLRQELEVSHRQFFKLLHHASSKNHKSNADNHQNKNNVGNKVINNMKLPELQSLQDLEQMREQLKLLEQNFHFAKQ